MAERELKLKLTGDASQAERAVARLEAALKKAETELAKARESADASNDEVGALGDRAEATARPVEQLGDSARVSGHDVQDLGKMAKPAAEAIDDLGRVFKVFGVDAEAGADAIRQMAKVAADTPEAFKAVGVELVQTRDGSVDLVETTKRLADRLSDIEDPAERAAVASKLLGERWRDLEPALARGSSGIEQARSKIDKLGDAAGAMARDRLGPLGDAADQLGINVEKLDPKLLVTGAGLAAFGAFAAQGVQKLTSLAEEVRKVHDISGLTFEDSSRLVAVSDDLGISADTAASSMGRLAKNIDAGKLEEYGIQVVRAKDGTVDMAATLGNVADAMNRTTDPTKRAAMGTALFGKSWADLAPVLQLGRKGIEDAFASVSDGQIVTEDNADAVRDWQMALDDAQDAVTEIQMAIGKELLPTLSLMAKDFATATNAIGKLTGEAVGFADLQGVLNPTMALYNARAREQTRANEEAARSMTGLALSAAEAAVRSGEAGRANQDLAEKEQAAAAQADILKARHQDVAQAAKDAAAATAEQKRQLDLLNGVTQSIVGAQLSAMQATNAFTDAQNDLAVKQRDATAAINEFGADSPQAQAAANDYARTLVNAQQSADSLAKATVEQARQQALAAGQSFTDAQGVLVYRDSLVNTRDATNDPKLKTGLDQLIALVDDSARAAGDAERKFYDAEAAARRLAAAASGALQTTNQGTIVGSADSTDRRLATQAATPASTSVTNNVTVNASTPANPWSIAQDVDWALRTAGR